MNKIEKLGVNNFEDGLNEVLVELEKANYQGDNVCIVLKTTGNRDKENKLEINAITYLDATDDEIINDLNG